MKSWESMHNNNGRWPEGINVDDILGGHIEGDPLSVSAKESRRLPFKEPSRRTTEMAFPMERPLWPHPQIETGRSWTRWPKNNARLTIFGFAHVPRGSNTKRHRSVKNMSKQSRTSDSGPQRFNPTRSLSEDLVYRLSKENRQPGTDRHTAGVQGTYKSRERHAWRINRKQTWNTSANALEIYRHLPLLLT